MGIEYETLVEGDGARFPQRMQTAVVHYVGTLTNGTQFDSSRSRGRPFEFKVGAGQVIRAWEEAVPRMSIGQRMRVTATHEYCYGASGAGDIIPPHATLIFEIELLAIK
jgi:FKBP-type peptidyl-prolyl cis-trans isomerase